MPKKPPPRDPISAYTRRVTAARCIGDKKCACGETRPEAFAKGKSKVCARCKRKRRGHARRDKHHVAGKANDPTTVSIDVNDHRARLTQDQLDWPKETRINPDGSPLLAAAGAIRGFIDTVMYLLEKLLLRHAEILEGIDAYLVRTLGRKWWLKTELKQFSPKR
jgi:hypothetical protein